MNQIRWRRVLYGMVMGIVYIAALAVVFIIGFLLVFLLIQFFVVGQS